MAEKEEKKDSETKDDRPLCPFCAQHINQEVLEQQEVKTQMAIPKGLWMSLAAKQAKINTCDVEAEEVTYELITKTNECAAAHRIATLIGLGIESELPGLAEDDGKKRENHQYEFFCIDPVTNRKYYLGIKLDEKEQGVLFDLWKGHMARTAKSRKASLEYFKALTVVAENLGWGFRPLRVDNGKFIAQSWVDEQVKKAREEGEKKGKEK